MIKKLAVKQCLTQNERTILCAALLTYGKLSEAYVQRKLKCSYSMAKEVINTLTSDNTYSVAFKKDE
jgi:hypothetical protein